MHEVLLRLLLGDMRTIGESDIVSAEIAEEQALFDIVAEGLTSCDPGLRMRCADAMEKASRGNPSLLLAHKTRLLQILGETQEIEVQWHLAQIVPRLSLTGSEFTNAVEILRGYFLKAKSRITQVCALQAIVELATQHPDLGQVAEEILVQALESSVPSLRARAKKLVSVQGMRTS